MTGQPRTPLTQTAVLTVEADLTDWAEQHQAVALPDDDYPHIGNAWLVGSAGWRMPVAPGMFWRMPDSVRR